MPPWIGRGDRAALSAVQVLEPRRLVAPQNVPHAVGFKLEDRRRLARAQTILRRFVIERQRPNRHERRDSVRPCARRHPKPSASSGPGNPSSRGRCARGLYVVLRRDFIPVRLYKRNDIRERLGEK